MNWPRYCHRTWINFPANRAIKAQQIMNEARRKKGEHNAPNDEKRKREKNRIICRANERVIFTYWVAISFKIKRNERIGRVTPSPVHDACHPGQSVWRCKASAGRSQSCVSLALLPVECVLRVALITGTLPHTRTHTGTHILPHTQSSYDSFIGHGTGVFLLFSLTHTITMWNTYNNNNSNTSTSSHNNNNNKNNRTVFQCRSRSNRNRW